MAYGANSVKYLAFFHPPATWPLDHSTTVAIGHRLIARLYWRLFRQLTLQYSRGISNRSFLFLSLLLANISVLCTVDFYDRRFMLEICGRLLCWEVPHKSDICAFSMSYKHFTQIFYLLSTIVISSWILLFRLLRFVPAFPATFPDWRSQDEPSRTEPN